MQPCARSAVLELMKPLERMAPDGDVCCPRPDTLPLISGTRSDSVSDVGSPFALSRWHCFLCTQFHRVSLKKDLILLLDQLQVLLCSKVLDSSNALMLADYYQLHGVIAM